MANKYKIVDSKFNRANYPDLIGKIVDVPPAYAQVELSQLPLPKGRGFKD